MFVKVSSLNAGERSFIILSVLIVTNLLGKNSKRPISHCVANDHHGLRPPCGVTLSTIPTSKSNVRSVDIGQSNFYNYLMSY